MANGPLVNLTAKNQGYFDRLQRAESWLEKAQELANSATHWDDLHGQFVFLWIAFNALYGRTKTDRFSEERDVKWFIPLICDWDAGRGLIKSAAEEVKRDADKLLREKYLCEKFWEEGSTRKVLTAVRCDEEEARRHWENGDVAAYLSKVFAYRLRVLRNQVFHGCSTDKSEKSRRSIVPAVRVLERLVPAFVGVFHERGPGEESWPEISYPRAGSPLNPDYT